MLCEQYKKIKEFDKAYKTLARASLLIQNPTDHFNYLWNLRLIKEKSAEIVFEEDNPHYDLYLIFFFEEFALDLARDLTGFPSCAHFYYRKKIQYSPDYGDDDEYYHNIALKKLNIYQYKQEIVSRFMDFVYNELPLIYGIPPKYSEDEANRIYKEMGPEWREMVRFSYEELKKSPIDIVPVKINEFVRNLLQEYYDKENS